MQANFTAICEIQYINCELLFQMKKQQNFIASIVLTLVKFRIEIPYQRDKNNLHHYNEILIWSNEILLRPNKTLLGPNKISLVQK